MLLKRILDLNGYFSAALFLSGNFTFFSNRGYLFIGAFVGCFFVFNSLSLLYLDINRGVNVFLTLFNVNVKRSRVFLKADILFDGGRS